TQQRGRYVAAAQDGKSSAGPLTIGYTTAAPFQPDLDITLAQSAVQALTLAITLLSRDGLSVEEMSFSYPPEYHKNFQTVWTTAIANVPVREGGEILLASLTRDFLLKARARTAERYQHAIEDLGQLAEDTRRIFGALDVVVTPVLAFTPPKVG